MIDYEGSKEMPLRYRGTEAPDNKAADYLDLTPLFECDGELGEIRPAPNRDEDWETALLA